jgi:UDP-N-acetylmuramoyl-tripeptide--D-alanyl-D-alanine ligase
LYVLWLFYIATALLYLRIQPISTVVVLVAAPYLMIIWIYLVTLIAWLYIEEPRRKKLLRRATKVFDEHPGAKVAIAGSYGKTTMKELLLAVISEEKKVAATPGNQNVPISHARWVEKLEGDEEILLIEYGEGAPKDIEKLAKLSSPDYAVITGIAPNHLDRYKTLASLKKDILSLGNFVPKEQIFVNADDKDLSATKFEHFSKTKVMGWDISGIEISIDGTRFVMKKAKKSMKISSQLLGGHLVGPTAFAAAFADSLGVSSKAIGESIAKMRPYDQRMQPRHVGGAWIIDDTYNGNLEGIKAGLELLSDVEAKRKIYVTPGLVDQGKETRRVHEEIGQAIARAKPDRVVLMKNSVTDIVYTSMDEAGYEGEVVIEEDPLGFYNNLDQYIAAGDVVLMQNDWTDNYH